MTLERISPSVPTRSGPAILPRPGVEVWLHTTNLVLIFALALMTAVGGVVQLQTALLAASAGATAVLLRMAALRTDEPRMRASWNWFAVTLFFWGGYCAVVSVTGERMAASFSDFGDISRYFRMAAYLSGVVALWFCVSVPRRLLARLFLDTGLVLAGVIVMVRVLLPHSSIHVLGSDLTNPLAYMWLVDLAALSLVLLSLVTLPHGAPLPAQFAYVSIALALMCIGHAGTALAALQLAPARPGWVYPFFGASSVTLSLMAYRCIRGKRTVTVYQTAVLAVPNPVTHSAWFYLGHAIVPYSIAMGAAMLLFTGALDAGPEGLNQQAAFAGAAGFVVLAGFRHIISYNENRDLYVNLTELNRGLEEQVAQRTIELSRRNQELEAVHQVALVSAASLDLTRILQAVAEQLAQAVDASRCVIFERASDDEPLNLAAFFQGTDGLTATQPEQPPGALGDAQHFLFEPAGHRTLSIQRKWLDTDSSTARLLDFHQAEVAMLVPLVAGEQTIGVAEIYRAQARPFSEHEVSLAEAITTQGALAAENARAYDMARFAANHDPVTGLLNHRALHDELTRLFERATRRNTRLTVLMMDLNLFKEFNDRYGHQAGDRVLDDIGQAIKQSMPTNAVVARYGGDEFTVGIPDCPPETTQIFIAAIRERVDAVQEKHGFVGEGFGVSIGVASYPEEGTELAEIIARADQSMYEDKWRLKGAVDRRRDSPLRIAPF
ncbi:hypothetical protein BH20CHL1_BH20CHL1_08220 [soil metagenome]